MHCELATGDLVRRVVEVMGIKEENGIVEMMMDYQKYEKTGLNITTV